MCSSYSVQITDIYIRHFLANALKRDVFVSFVYINRSCAEATTLAPPHSGDVGPGRDNAKRLELSLCFQTASFLLVLNMAGTVANKCLSPLAFITRRVSAPEFITQCCYHKKVKTSSLLTLLLCHERTVCCRTSWPLCLQVVQLIYSEMETSCCR